jgi:hypothetical protein
MIRWLAVLAVMCALVSARPATAKECQGIAFPDTITLGGETLRLNGLGLREATIFKVDVYVAALYVAKPSSDPKTLITAKTPKQLVLQFVRDVDVDDITDAWTEGFDKTAGAAVAAIQPQIDQLNGWMAPMVEGKRMVFSDLPGNGLEVTVGGVKKGTIKGGNFAEAFLTIWLGDDPPNAGLKDGLLGGTCGA